MEINKSDDTIRSLIHKLSDKNGLEREKARIELIKTGEKVIPYLTDLTDHPLHIVRWESMKTLSEIAVESLIPVFEERLEHDESEIRWMAAEGLINIGGAAIKPILKLLLEKTDSVFVLSGAHHFFHELNKEDKLPEDFPVQELLSMLKATSLNEKLKVFVYRILNELK